MAQSLNMTDWVTPNHWNPSQFEALDGLDVRHEFALIATMVIYFLVDQCRVAEAHNALKTLSMAGHPFIQGHEGPIEDMLKMRHTPDGLINRYNALVMWMAEEVQPGIKARIDELGAFAFCVGSDCNVLSGDIAGIFAIFGSFGYLRDRIHAAVDEAEDEEAFA